MIWRVEVEYCEVRHHATDLMELAGCGPGERDPVVAHTGDAVDRLYEHPRRVLRDPVARGVVHGVAGRAAHAEELRLRLRPGADARNVLVPEAVDLRGSHHHVTLAGPDDIEHLRERHPR